MNIQGLTLKMEYLDRLTKQRDYTGLQQRIQRLCDSIEKDLGLTAKPEGEKAQQGFNNLTVRSSERDLQRFPSVYIGPRKSGRSTQLINLSAEKGIPILAHNSYMKSYLLGLAKDMGKSIEIITLKDLEDRSFRTDVIIDEVQLMLETIMRIKIRAVSVTTYDQHNLEHIPYDELEKNL